MLTQNDVKIAKLLIEEENLTIKDIQEHVGISNKTAIKILENLNSKLSIYELSVLKKHGKGISICGDVKNINNLKSEIFTRLEILNLEFTELTLEIIVKIFEEKYTTNQISDILYVSNSLVKKNICLINNFTRNFKIKINYMNNHIVYFEGDEKNIRKLLTYVLLDVFSVEVISDILHKSDANWKIAKIFYPIVDKEKMLFILEMINFYSAKNGYKLSGKSIARLTISILVIVWRRDKQLQESVGQTFFTSTKEKLKILHSVMNEYETKYKIVFSKNDLNELERVFAQSDYLNSTMSYDQNTNILKEIIVEALLKEEYNFVNFVNDRVMMEKLISHLIPAIERMKQKNYIFCSLKEEIKIRYLFSYEIAFRLLKEIQNKFIFFEIVDDEVVLLALYFQLFLEKNETSSSTPYSVALISSSGSSIFEYLEFMVKKTNQQIGNIDIISVFDYSEEYANKYDFILSTSGVCYDNKDVIYISSLLNENDQIAINKKINALNQEKDKNLSNHILEDYDYIEISTESRELFLEMVGSYLVENSYVKKEYINTMFEREKICSTAIKKFAVPHGNFNYAIKNKIVVVKNDKKIKWENTNIEYAIFPIFTVERIKIVPYVMSEIYKLTNGTNFDKWLKTERVFNEQNNN